MEFLLVLAVLVAVVFIVTGPLRPSRGASEGIDFGERDGSSGNRLRGLAVRGRAGGAGGAGELERDSELGELEAAREAKYREIRDTQLDYDTGKLSVEDFQALDTSLRRQALEILQRIDAVRRAPTGSGASERPEPGLGDPE